MSRKHAYYTPTYNLTGTLDSLAFLDQSIGTEEHNTDLASFQVHAHTLDTGCELDKLLGLDIVHAMDTGDTVTMPSSAIALPIIIFHCQRVPNREDTTSLGQAGLLGDTADPLLEDGRDFGRGGLALGGICALCLAGNVECGWRTHL
jgi:hypothetical protein